jgi:hypothetical protein
MFSVFKHGQMNNKELRTILGMYRKKKHSKWYKYRLLFQFEYKAGVFL